MTKLRDDLRSAFDREQTALGEVGDARHRLVRNALAARDVPASRGLQWAAAIAAVLIAVIVIATFALARANSHSQVVPASTPTPKAAVSPTPLTNALGVPDATPIITFGDPAKPGQVDGVTWDGKLSGVLVYQPVGAGNPANNLFGTATEIRDRGGKLSAAGNFGTKAFAGTWADDEFHFCQMVPFGYLGVNGVQATLQLGDARVGGVTNVAQVGKVYEQVSTRVAACSVLADRAVVVQSGGQGVGTAQYWVVQVSTGKILWTHSFDLNALPVQVVASRDGMFVAESQAALNGNQTTWSSTIFGPTGSRVGQLPGAVSGFSWDGSLAVIDPGGVIGPVKIVRVQDGTAVWTGPIGYGADQVAAEPSGSSVAIWLFSASQSQSSAGSPLPHELYVIAGDGRVVVHFHNTF
jgi:hypothetical protein